MNEKENLGKEVKANYATSGTFDYGTIIAYCHQPTYIIERKDGSRFSWVADLCEIKEELGIDKTE
jgi:hypothetical protein